MISLKNLRKFHHQETYFLAGFVEKITDFHLESRKSYADGYLLGIRSLQLKTPYEIDATYDQEVEAVAEAEKMIKKEKWDQLPGMRFIVFRGHKTAVKAGKTYAIPTKMITLL